eukprot:4685024-Amphidinium_carterae.1
MTICEKNPWDVRASCASLSMGMVRFTNGVVQEGDDVDVTQLTESEANDVEISDIMWVGPPHDLAPR